MQFFTLSKEDFNNEVIKTRNKIINYKLLINDYEIYITNELSELLTQPNNKNTDKQTKENFIFNIINNLFSLR